ncbi:hypothetical protein AM588_10011524 [Phytophthora nicotianae]|uniref:Anaphase-promoting complex subunit 4-like WD40 domain-containing protein n=1 Tax=Phytophthora nicotianae TaxID=4792 RepID=A0A0W8DPT4_PHYNI|nr:hypothetical protein AM588_10011524 [Phytophthora nicotianae]
MSLRGDSIPRSKAAAYVQLPELDGHSRKVYALASIVMALCWPQGPTTAASASGTHYRTHHNPGLRFFSKLLMCLLALYCLSGAGAYGTAWTLGLDFVSCLGPYNTAPLGQHGLRQDGALLGHQDRPHRQQRLIAGDAVNIAYSHDAKYVVVGNLDCITLIDTRKARVVRRVVNPFESYEMQFSRTGFLFVAAGHAAGFGTFEIMRIVTEKKGNPNLESAHKEVVYAWTSTRQEDSLVSIWDLEELYCVKTFVVTTSSIRSVRFSHDGKYIAIGMDDPNLVVMDVESGEKAVKLQLQNNVQYLSWHPNKNVLAYVGDKASSDKNSNRDGVIKMIEMKD